MTLEEIENTTGFVGNLEKIELPSQLVAVLADPLLQKLLLLRPSDDSDQRIANWLNSALRDVLDGDADEGTLFDVLDVLREYVVSTKVSTEIALSDRRSLSRNYLHCCSISLPASYPYGTGLVDKMSCSRFSHMFLCANSKVRDRSNPKPN